MLQGKYSCSPLTAFMSLWKHRSLFWQLTKRDVVGRYRGSIMGLTWSFFNPILMLAIYTFVFSVVFKARWEVGSDDKTQFAIVLFAGMIVHSLFAECLNRSVAVILNNVNYVKKVVFPLEILPWVAFGSALFHDVVSMAVLLIFYLIIHLSLHWTVIFLPVLIIPFALLIMGVSWFLASTGVFIRDVGQTIGIVTTIMLFLSPVFYPVSALPEKLRPLLHLNPLTFIIEQVRAVLIWGNLPNWTGLLIYMVCSMLIAWVGFFWFQKTRKGFADVL
jgi:lipopolysaccharide transport system permease protein